MNKFSSVNGYTLTELVLAGFIFVIITAVVSTFVIFYFQNYEFSFEENQSISLAQGSMTTIIRELREARGAENGAWAIAQAEDNELILYTDINNDSKTDRVRYYIDGSELKKGIIEPTQNPVEYLSENEQIFTITEHVDNNGNPLFTYYNGDWPADQINNPLTQGERILNTRYIEVYLNININPNSGSQPYELTSGVQIRSLKDNL